MSKLLIHKKMLFKELKALNEQLRWNDVFD
jgi:hypothetical protein